MSDSYTYQNAVASSQKELVLNYPFVAQVKAVYSDRMACDLQTWDGGEIYNVPVLTRCGINTQNEIWGEMDFPQVDDYVIVLFVGPYTSQPLIIGTVFPFLLSYFQSNQTPVNSSNKQFTKKLLETSHENTYRRIFKSGTSVEVGEDGTTTVETPSGSYIQIDESGNDITIEPKNKLSIKNASQNLYTLLSNLQSALNSFSDLVAQGDITAGGGNSGSLATAINGLLASLNSAVVSFGTSLGELMQ